MMTEEMRSALINAEHAGQGAKVSADAITLLKLETAGLIGKNDGMTRKGTIERERLLTATFDELFG
jgi:hypothetical protein